jgi:hypothetical protein
MEVRDPTDPTYNPAGIDRAIRGIRLGRPNAKKSMWGRFKGLFQSKPQMNNQGRVPMLNVGDQGGIGNSGKFVAPTNNTKEQNRFRRVLTLLSEQNFDTFFPQKKGISGSEISAVKHNDNTQIKELINLPDKVPFDLKNNLPTIYDYGYRLRNTTLDDEGKKDMANLYNDLLLMVVQLMFLQTSLIMDNGIRPLLQKIPESDNKKKIEETIQGVQKESDVAAAQKNSRITTQFWMKRIALTVWTTLNTGTLINISIGTFGLGSVIAILVLLPSLAAANNAIAGYFNQKIKVLLEKNALALRTVFTIMFDYRNKISIFELGDLIKWRFNKEQIKILKIIGETYPGYSSNNREMVYDDNYFRLMSRFMMAAQDGYENKGSNVLMEDMVPKEQISAALDACLQNGRGKKMLIEKLTNIICASDPKCSSAGGGGKTRRRKFHKHYIRKTRRV